MSKGNKSEKKISIFIEMFTLVDISISVNSYLQIF